MAKKIVLSTRIDEDAVKDLKFLSVDTGKSIGALLEKGVALLVEHYRGESSFYQTRLGSDLKKKPSPKK